MISKDNSNSTPIIRRANQGDIQALLDICGESFPDSLRWQSPRTLGRKWWDATLTSSSNETWVCIKNGEIAGFCVLVTDQNEAVTGGRAHNGSFFERLYAVLAHPKLAFFRIQKKIRGVVATAGNHSKSSPTHSRIDDNPVWLGLIAVSPGTRGQGLAKEMLCFCGDRTFQLDRHAIKLRVDSDNMPARSLYERVGFVCTSQKSIDRIYTRVVTQQDKENPPGQTR